MTDDAALAEPEAPARGRRRRGRPGLYEPVGWVLVRAPLLPVEAYLDIGPANGLAPRDPLVRTALAVGSKDLLAELERAGTRTGRAARRPRAKLLRYLIRMSTRPTPYGLFAAVGLAELGTATDLRIGEPAARTRTRPDMQWLLRLVALLEARPEVRRRLRLVANPAARRHGDRILLAERATLGDGANASPVGIRATGVVLRALRAARTPVTWEQLAQDLLETPEATPEKVEQLLTELWEQTFLLCELRPPLTHPSPARHVVDCLAGVAPAAAERDALEALLEAMAGWDELAMHERPAAYRSLGAIAARAVPDFDDTVAQVDAALALRGAALHEDVAREAADAAELLLRLSPASGTGTLDAYRRAFAGRYGTDREIPLLELLDPEHGLGSPAGHGHHRAGVDQAKLALRNQTLRRLAIDALRDRRLVVTLDDATLAHLVLCTPTATDAPVSLDLAVFVVARSLADIDSGAFQLLIGPNLGGQEAGRNLGRFGDLLGSAGARALADAAAAAGSQHPGDVAVEVVYLPRNGRSANVAIRPRVHSHEIAMGTMPGVAPDDAIALADVLVGVRDGRFYARVPSLQGDLRARAGHMLNAVQAPPACRLLEDIARDGRMQLSSFDWGPVAELAFLPRIQRGRVILAPAQWQIDVATRDADLDPAQPGFAAAVARWREAWMVPRHAYLTFADNRLLLDLESPEQLEALREELRGLTPGGWLVLQEPLPAPEHAWLTGPGGQHLTELVVPLALRAPAPAPPADAERPAAATRTRRHAAGLVEDRLRPPGSDWLYIKLYGPREAEEDLLTGPLRSFCRFATGSGLAQRWFFLRYSDPDPHLRLRFGGTPDVLVAELLPMVCAWAGELIAEGRSERFCVDTYEREVERYGGSSAIASAEALFAADSVAVVELLQLARSRRSSLDRATLAVVSIDALLEGLGLDRAERLAWCRRQVSEKHLSGDDYRARREQLRQLLGRGGAPELTHVLSTRDTALTTIASRLRELDALDELESPLERLCESYVHLHCNRLLGPGSPSEQHVLGLLLRTLEGLERAPLAARSQA